jgi:hypothetical protein
MFGINKEQLVKGLCRLSCGLCGYMGSRCDCKYMQNNDDAMNFDSEATGCPETAMAATLINIMSTQEFYALAQRAGIRVSLPEEPEVQIGVFMKQLQEQRDARLKQDAQRFTADRAAKKAARIAKKATKK